MKVIDLGEESRVLVKSWLPDKGTENDLDDFDEGTLEQVTNLTKHPAVSYHVAIMPDAHSGYGMPIGGVIACDNAVIPNAVGVDIGCGMCSIKTDIVADHIRKEELQEIRLKLEKHIPVGDGQVHRGIQDWRGFDQYSEKYGRPDWLKEEFSKKWVWFRRSMGTLGGGNHFIELQTCDDNHLWVTLHSGSRNLGHMVCSYYNNLALELNLKWKSEIPHKDLAFLPADSEEGESYIIDMNFALDFAYENRQRMMQSVKNTLRGVFDGMDVIEEINIHHNYAALENHFGRNVWIHRKGATLASEGTKGIIPGSMGTPTYIVKGLGNRDSFNSCSHGAGRKMGRMDACRRLDQAECEKAMEGIEFAGYGTVRRKKNTMVDLGEAPQAYKDIDEVMEAQKDLVLPIVKLRPLMVVKG